MGKNTKKSVVPVQENKAEKRLVLFLLSAAAALVLFVAAGWNYGVGEWFSHFDDPVVKEIDVFGINSPYAVMIQAKGGRSLCESLADERIYPASMTKILTAVVVIGRLKELDEEITLGEDAFEGLYEADAAQAGFEPGETVPVLDLLHGMLLASGAECCRALAIRIAGSEEAFVRLMNDKAAKIGMRHSHFTNTTGLQDPEHYSTARDMAILLKYAIRNRTFCDIVEKEYYTTSPTNVHPDGFTIYSGLFRYLPDARVTGGVILGGKTGYTSDAGLCLASYARIEGRQYVLVTAGAQANGNPLHVYDATELFDRVGQEAERLRYGE